jgi:superfamily II DNA or RNA helicase
MTSLRLRPYQEECLKNIKEHHKKGIHRLLISMATGAGKTVVFASLIQQMGLKALVIAHTNELLNQSKDKIQMISPSLNVGIVNADSKEFNAPVVVSSIQSARIEKNLEALKVQDFGLLVYDEAHRSGSNSSRTVIDELGFGKDTNKLICGFSATCWRDDGKGLGEIYDTIAYEKNIKEMIEEGYLCPPKGIKIATDIDLSLVKMGGDDDFQAESLSQVMDVPEIRQIIVDAYLSHGEGRQTICFGVTVQNACNLCELFKQSGIKAALIHGGTPKQERTDILKRYRTRQIQVLCNCNVLTEGFDSCETSCVIVARPTQSTGLFQQMCGRGLRLFPNKKDCLILDLCTKSHSLCNSATLLDDSEEQKQEEKEEKNKEREIKAALPANLNQKLKSALINFDPLGESFTWSMQEGTFILKGINARLGVVPCGEDRYRVVFANEKGIQTIADGLTFSYAFASAEDFAKANRSLFIISDRDAYWRDQPASIKQLECIRKKGYRAGIENLTRGQASDLISSGKLGKTG